MPNFKLGGEVQSLRELHFPAALGALVLLRRRQFPSSVLWAGYTEADCLVSSNQLWLAVPRGPDMQQLQKSNRLRNNPGVSLLRLPLRSSSSSMIRQPQKRTDAPSQAPTVAPSVLPTCSPSTFVGFIFSSDNVSPGEILQQAWQVLLVLLVTSVFALWRWRAEKGCLYRTATLTAG